MELALSPVYSSWDRNRLRDFYLKEVIDLDVSAVYIGEVICQKRSALKEEDYKEIITALKDHGKAVYLSTLALVTNNNELGETKKYAPLFDGIEVNSFGVLNLIIKDEALKDKDIIIGPFMNIYNSFAANYLKKFNPKRFIPPYEIPLDTIKDIAENSDVALEVFSWGHLSTALSWRCYSARMHNLGRDNCMEKCFENPDGVLLKTMDKEDLFIIGGTQVLSSKTHCAIEEINTLREAGISYLRISPFYENTADVIRIFRGVINKEIDRKEAVEMLAEHAPHGLSNGWLLGKPGWEYVTT